MNLSIEATDWAAGLIHPRDGTSGHGIANGVLEVTTAGGLFILLKNVWRIRIRWIALLLPASYAALRVLYDCESIVMHWTF